MPVKPQQGSCLWLHYIGGCTAEMFVPLDGPAAAVRVLVLHGHVYCLVGVQQGCLTAKVSAAARLFVLRGACRSSVSAMPGCSSHWLLP
jgi:hypothetical protein